MVYIPSRNFYCYKITYIVIVFSLFDPQFNYSYILKKTRTHTHTRRRGSFKNYFFQEESKVIFHLYLEKNIK